MRVRHAAADVTVILMAGWLPACGGNERVPTAASPAPVIARITIDGPHVVPTRSNVNYIATAVLSSGATMRNVRPVSWTTNNQDVAIISSAPDGYGGLAALKAGVVTVTASHQGVSATLSVDVRDETSSGAARVEIRYSPNPVVASPTRCPRGTDPFAPSWSFTETIAETRGGGFTQETFTFNLYDDQLLLLYSDTEFEKNRLEAHSVFVEEFCTSLVGRNNGFYTDIIEGIDDTGNRMAFGGELLRLLSVGAVSQMSNPLPIVPMAAGMAVHGPRRRIH